MYTPDSWKIILFDSDDFGKVYKVLAGWYGGYANGDSWKLNSGIIEVVETDNFYDFYGSSGSIYHCTKTGEHISGIMGGMLSSWQEQAKEYPGVSIEAVSYEDFINDKVVPD